MKKIFAFLLMLAMLLPMGLLPVANAEEFTEEPFYALSWSDMDNKAYPYLDGLVQSNFSTSGANATISYSGVQVVYNKDGLDQAKVKQFAEKMKATMDARPDGMRYWHLWAPGKVLRLKPENIIYLDYGVDMMKVLVHDILKAYKEIGGKLDGLVVDTEYIGMSSYYIYTNTDKNPNNATKDAMIYKKIVEDPRYATEVRPLLEERGFKFYHNITDYTPEIYSIAKGAGSQYEQSQAIWDTVMRIRLNNYCTEWAFEALQEFYPECSLSDYQSTDRSTWLKIEAATDDGESNSSGNTKKAGNVSCFSFYYNRPSTDFFDSLGKYAGYNEAIFEGTSFSTLLYNVNYAKSMYAATDTKMIAPWITSYVYNAKKPSTLAKTPYYAELLYHLGMLDPEPFLSYTYTGEYSAENWELTCQVMNDVMAELTRVAGFSDRKPIETDMYWNGEFILSGMYTGGRNLWRLTPNNNRISLADFQVAGAADPTFNVEGHTITFPGGKIIADTNIENAGSFGFWVETPKNVTPIVTRDDYYFAKYPSLVFDFEDAAEGVYDYNNHKPLTAWEFTWKKGATTTIEKVNGNKVLALNGSVEVRSAKLPVNISAGDSYAEDQAWQVTVTVPEGLAADGEISLLYYAGTSQKAKDGGFQIKGGKLYYSTLGTDAEGKATQEYKELCDIAPGTYIFRREMNMNNKDAFRSNFAIYDTTGAELKRVNNIASPVFKTITTINFATKNTDKPVYLDDYKLILTGTATDFELYDVHTGMPVASENMEALRDRSTAYRLSWLNATDKEETATVMAAIYNGTTLVEEKVIKEVKMTPDYDGVETGIVELAEGQSVKVYLKTTIKKAEEPSTQPTEPTNPTDPTEPTTGDKDDKGGLSTGLIAVIVAVAVAVAGVVVVLVVTKKSKTKK